MVKAAARLSNDPDFVLYTKYSKTKGVLPDLPSDPPPDWRPLRIVNPLTFGRAQLPEDVDKGSPIALFDLYFDAAILDRIAYHTNQHAEKLRAASPTACRGWKPTSPNELYTYFAIVIYMGLHREPSLAEYWEKGHRSAPTHKVNEHMAQKRWEQLDRYLYCTEVEQSFFSPFGRIWDLSELIRERTLSLWLPGKHLCVDEAIARFTGRASEKVIIKTKPTPEGYKIWCLANDGVILNWLFHARGAGKGPINLLKSTDVRLQSLTPTELVPVTLVLAEDSAGQRLFQRDFHIVWDDNLFNTIPMLEYLRSEGVGCAGTVRTTKTATEETFEVTAEAELQTGSTYVARQKLSKERFNADLVRLKTHNSKSLKWGEIRWALSASKNVLEAAWRDNQVVLFASTVAEREY
jgi:hypothetical protein